MFKKYTIVALGALVFAGQASGMSCLRRLWAPSAVAAASVLAAKTTLCEEKQKPLLPQELTGSIDRLSFHVYGGRKEILRCVHLHSGSEILFGPREDSICGDRSCRDGEKGPQVLQVSKGELSDLPADRDRKIADIEWFNVYNSSTGGPIFKISPEMDCRLTQPRDVNSLHSLLMKCRPVGATGSEQDHSFYFSKVGSSKYSKRIYGEYTLKNPEKKGVYTEFHLQGWKEFNENDRPRVCWPNHKCYRDSDYYMKCDDFK